VHVVDPVVNANDASPIGQHHDVDNIGGPSVGRPAMLSKSVMTRSAAAVSTAPRSRRPRWRFNTFGVNPTGGERH
jgi:hypothetical protein